MTGGAGAVGRARRTAFDCQACWLSKIDPQRFGAASGKGERERERGRESEAGRARSPAEIGATSPDRGSNPDQKQEQQQHRRDPRRARERGPKSPLQRLEVRVQERREGRERQQERIC